MRQPRWEQRQAVRYPGQTLVLKVNGCIHPFIDISVGGLSFEGEGFVRGQEINVRISSVLDAADTISTTCRVANVCGPRVGVSIAPCSSRLLRYIVVHIANLTETEPPVVKKHIIAK
ncbi:PilZ domain-containing protein [Paramagnetospirillum magneticum]|uniref:PilZ domain-containing protein n=1 Tax=Paramagnetospirillum magneticum TaxID=84159 RepID=UPI000A042410|nr:PilZ domain-containing protein [Paramagnetospirillum magneticum]